MAVGEIMALATPLSNGANGRDRGGHFLPGNPGGPGNPHTRRSAEVRRMLADAVTEDDVLAVVAALVKAARMGEPWAVKELLDRTMGKPVTTVELTAIDAREAIQNGATDVLNPHQQAKLDEYKRLMLAGSAVLDPRRQAQLDELNRRVREDMEKDEPESLP